MAKGRRAKVVNMNKCGDCANCTPVYIFRTLDIDKNPTMGECPYWTESKCVLLSWMSDCKHFKEKTA